MWTDQVIILNEVAADGASAAILMLGMRHIELQVAMTGFTGTVKFAGSNADAAPNFGAAATKTNPWDYIKCVNQIDGSAVNGGTGLVGSATTSVTQLEANVNAFKWIAAIVSGFSGGTLSVKGKGVNDSASV